MNSMPVKTLASSFFLIGALGSCSPTPETTVAPTAATTAVAPMPAEHPADGAAAMPAHDSAGDTMAIPDSADGIWQSIEQHRAELQASIQKGSLEHVHHHAFAIRDLVAALPEHSPSLPAEDQTKLQSEVKTVANLADKLDATGDAGDRAGSQANYDKLVTVLNGITRTK